MSSSMAYEFPADQHYSAVKSATGHTLSALQNPRNALPPLIIDLQDQLSKGSGLAILVLDALVFSVPRLLAVFGLGVLTEDVVVGVVWVEGGDGFEDFDLIATFDGWNTVLMCEKWRDR